MSVKSINDKWIYMGELIRVYKILTTTGCYGTGSSAVTDFVREFDGVSCQSDYEVRILQDPDGVSDLEYNLIENPNRHNSSNSLKRFMRMSRDLDHIWFIKRYSKHLGSDYLKCINRFTEKLYTQSYHGAWHQDIIDRGKLFYILSRTSSRFSWFAHKHFRLPTSQRRGLLPADEKAYITTLKIDVFLNAVRDFMDEMAALVDKNNYQVVMYDQLVPPSNFRRFVRYFYDVRIILVERDPRDIYILEKYFWHGLAVPYNNIETFCDWFIWTRSMYETGDLPSETMIIQFEDMIYKYDETIISIMNHFNLDEKLHIRKGQYFNPDISKNNTHLWINYPEEDENIKRIEERLSRYCYSFDETKTGSLLDEKLVF